MSKRFASKEERHLTKRLVHYPRMDSLEKSGKRRTVDTLCGLRTLTCHTSAWDFDCEECRKRQAKPVAILVYRDGKVYSMKPKKDLK